MDLANLPVTKIVRHKKVDLAAVRIAPPPTAINIRLETIPIEEKEPLHEGADVVVCGFPYGMDVHEGKSVLSSFARGMVSHILPHTSVPRDGVIHYLLHMTVNPGNSGGPVVDPIRRCVYAIISRGIQNSGLVIAEPIHGPRGRHLMKLCLDDTGRPPAPSPVDPVQQSGAPSLSPAPGGHP